MKRFDAVMSGSLSSQIDNSVFEIDGEGDIIDFSAERELLCVAFVDVVGFSALMHGDEEGTFHRWKEMRDNLVVPLLHEHRGRLVKSTGDGILATFADAVDGAWWSHSLQSQARQRRQGLALRIALNFCQTLPDGDDLLGDGVNIAARLQEHARSGGIIMTGTMNTQLKQCADMEIRGIGPIALRKLDYTVDAYEIITDGRMVIQHPSHRDATLPSIAVLPFRNLSVNDEDEYLSTGIVEDITVSLARHADLVVVARSSTITFARQDIDSRTAGEALGVRYVIVGTLRRQSRRIRISAQLLEAQTAYQVATFKHDFEEQDTFQVQDEIVEMTLTHLLPGMHSAERRKTLRKWPENFNSYDHYLKSIDLIGSLERTEFDAAIGHLNLAMQADPGFSAPRAWAARWHSLRVGQGWSDQPLEDAKSALTLATEAIRLDAQNALAHATYGHVLSYLFGDFDKGIQYLDRACDLNPNSSTAWLLSSVTLSSLGRVEEAITAANRALRLSPFDQRLFLFFTYLGIAHYDGGNYGEAISWLYRALAENPRYTSALRTLAVAQVADGRSAAARETMRGLLVLEPNFSLARYRKLHKLYSNPARADVFRQRLHESGSPP